LVLAWGTNLTYAKIALRSPSRWITFGSHAASECPKVIRELKNRLLSRPLSRAASKPSFGGFIITLLFPIFTGILAYDWLPNEYYDARRHELLASHWDCDGNGHCGDINDAWMDKKTGGCSIELILRDTGNPKQSVWHPSICFMRSSVASSLRI
jgi:hypothetical protein